MDNSTKQGPTRFIVADDHPLVRRGMRMILENAFPSSVVVEAGDLDSALVAIDTQLESFLLIDLDMPGMNGTESLRALRVGFPHLLISVLTGNGDTQTMLDALAAGINGYIVKASCPEDVIHAISSICNGQVYLAGTVYRPSVTHEQTTGLQPNSATTGGASLTARQRQVVTALMKGHSNKQIARDLNIGLGTVKIHLASIFRALGAQNRTEAVMIAVQQNL